MHRSTVAWIRERIKSLSWQTTRAIQSVVLVAGLVSGCSGAREVRDDVRPAPAGLAHEVFLIGDAGGADDMTDAPALRLLHRMTEYSDTSSLVVFLGDNVYCCGLPSGDDGERLRAEQRLNSQIAAVRDFAGRAVFIPGNHDRGSDRTGESIALGRQEAYIDSALRPASGTDSSLSTSSYPGLRRPVFLPPRGSAGPEVLPLGPDLALVLFDTEQWLGLFSRPDSAAAVERNRMMESARVLFRSFPDRDLLVVGHHPLHSDGHHGGKFSFSDHVFPLRALWSGAWIPLPLIGSLYPLFRKAAPRPEDLAHPGYTRYRQFMEQLLSIPQHRLVYAAGHEHNLQFFADGPFFEIISGSGSKRDYVSSRGSATFSSDSPGFFRLLYYSDRRLTVEAWSASDDDRSGRLLFSVEIAADATVGTAPPTSVPAGSHARTDN